MRREALPVPVAGGAAARVRHRPLGLAFGGSGAGDQGRSEEHTSELQSLMRISYAVFCLKKKTAQNKTQKSSNETTTHRHNTKQNTTTQLTHTYYGIVKTN